MRRFIYPMLWSGFASLLLFSFCILERTSHAQALVDGQLADVQLADVQLTSQTAVVPVGRYLQRHS